MVRYWLGKLKVRELLIRLNFQLKRYFDNTNSTSVAASVLERFLLVTLIDGLVPSASRTAHLGKFGAIRVNFFVLRLSDLEFLYKVISINESGIVVSRSPQIVESEKYSALAFDGEFTFPPDELVPCDVATSDDSIELVYYEEL